MNLLTCVDSSTDSKNGQKQIERGPNFVSLFSGVSSQMSCVGCQVSHVRCHLLCVTCYLSPVTNANSHSHRPSPCSVGCFAKTLKTMEFFKTQTILKTAKTQKCLGVCQYKEYALQPEVSRPLVSRSSAMAQHLDIAVMHIHFIK